MRLPLKSTKKEFTEVLNTYLPFLDVIKNRVDLKFFDLIESYYFKDEKLKDIAEREGVTVHRIRQKIGKGKEVLERIINSTYIENGELLDKQLTPDSPIEYIYFPVKIENVLKRNDIKYIKDIRAYTVVDILKFRTMSVNATIELLQVINSKGLNYEDVLKDISEDEKIQLMGPEIIVKDILEKAGLR